MRVVYLVGRREGVDPADQVPLLVVLDDVCGLCLIRVVPRRGRGRGEGEERGRMGL